MGINREFLKMAAEEVYQKILEHLKKEGPLNTFRLARTLNLDRSKLLNFVEKMEKAGTVEVQHGLVKFLKFVAEEKQVKRPVEVEKPVPKLKKKAVKKIREKTATPKVQAENNELKEKLRKLESKIEELEQKASAPPKIIKKTIAKEVPVPSVPTLTPPSSKKKRKKSKKKKLKKVKKKPKKKEEKKKIKKAKKKSKKFKLPKFAFMKNIKTLKKPEFVK